MTELRSCKLVESPYLEVLSWGQNQCATRKSWDSVEHFKATIPDHLLKIHLSETVSSTITLELITWIPAQAH